jgi:hypothetical protein
MRSRLMPARNAMSVCLLALCTVSAQAQVTTRTKPSDVRDMLSAALEIVLPDTAVVSGVAVGTRTIALDRSRIQNSLAIASLPVDSSTAMPRRRAYSDAEISTLSDCSAVGRGPCASLGDRVYVVSEVLAMTDSSATVRVSAQWASRAPGNRIKRVQNLDRAYLVGWTKLIRMRRISKDAWGADGEARVFAH